MIFDIVAPLTAPQIATPKPTATPESRPLRRLDTQLLAHLHDAGTCHVWSLLNVVADAESPRDRTHARLLRLELLNRIRHLRRSGLLFSVGRNKISPSKPAPAAQRPAVRGRRRTVRGLRAFRAVSADTGSGSQQAPCATHQVHRQMVSEPSIPCPPTIQIEKTVSGNVPERISEAARRLAKLPRNQPRKLTGRLHGQRCWRGRLLALPDGEVAPLYWCCRGRVLLAGYRDDPLVDENTEFVRHLLWAVRREKDVRLYKRPEAVLLGSGKAGVKERPSLRKQEAARRNGAKPARRGPRGRPKAFMFP